VIFLGLIISKKKLLEKMQNELLLINIPDFKGSNGWLDRFIKRYQIAKRRVTGCGKKLPEDMTDLIWAHIGEVNELIESQGFYLKL
jgi:hypothetical protein